MRNASRRAKSCWAAWALCLSLAAPVSAGPRDPLYVWTDASGITRYTTHWKRIPFDERGQAKTVAHGDDSPLLARMAVLENRIATDQAAVADSLGEQSSDAQRAVLTEIAERLPRLQAELETLRSRLQPQLPDEGS